MTPAPDVEDAEYPALLEAAECADLDPAGAQLVSLSSRAMWHLPTARAAVAITRPGTCDHGRVIQEARAVRAARACGVRTPDLRHDVIDLAGERFALVFDWIEGSAPSPGSWPPIVAEAAKLARAPTDGIQTLRLDRAATDGQWATILGPSLAPDFAKRWQRASREVDDLAATGPLVLAHGDLQPANVLVDSAGTPWLLDFECARLAPVEWDPAKIIILGNRFGNPHEPGPLLSAWPPLDPSRLARCVAAQEVLNVGWLVQMAINGTADAAAEARRRAGSLAQSDARWRHLR